MITPEIKTHEVDEPANLGEFCGIRPPKLSQTSFQLHSRCSETFYRKEIETGIKSGPSKSEQERNKMLELLKRVEDEEVELSRPSDEEDEEDSLARRVSAIDISSASSDDLLRLLNKQEKDKFFAALKDPSSDLVQELLASAELEKNRQLPWWEAPADDDRSSPRSPRTPHSIKPDLMVVPTDLIGQASHGTSLLYNICVVLLAYTYVTRHLSMSPLGSTTNDPQDQHEARKMILQSVPFLRDRKSKVLHLSLTDAVTSFWSRFDAGSIDKKAMLILLKDTVEFVRPLKVIALGDFPSGEQEELGTLATNHPFSTTIMAISDISSLFQTGLDSSGSAHRSHIVMKLTFYAAHVLSTPASHLHALADEIQSLSKSMGRETH